MIGTTISYGGLTLTRINDSEPYSAEYRFGDSTHEVRMRIRHSKVNATPLLHARDRHNVEVVETVYAAGDVPEYTRKCYFVLENKPGDTSVANMDALCDLAIASSNAFLTSVIGWDS